MADVSATAILASIHVLLVEDDPITAFNTERALRQSEDVATVTVAIDGQDALDQLRSGKVPAGRRVVITDLSMPRMSGLELAAAMRDEPGLSVLPVVVLTSSTDDADREAAYALHVAGYFVKAFAGPHLEATKAWLRAYCVGMEFEPPADVVPVNDS